ncbi:hypothetical protein OO258_10570 [Pseudomonas sp. DCB_BI]|nr:hypothetical protein [Pseudomonas sp. BN607]MCX2888681.1 hypothetical protein [Pseudomonas sp. DCB_BI]
MLALNLTIQFGHRYCDHRRIVLDLLDTGLCLAYEQRLRVGLQVWFEIAKSPVCQVIEALRDLGEKCLAVPPQHEAAEKTPIGLVAQAPAQFAVHFVDTLERTPRRTRVPRYVKKHPTGRVEQHALLNHREYRHLLDLATQHFQLPGLHQVARQAQQLALLAHRHQQAELAVIQGSLLPGFVGVHKHAVAQGIHKPRHHVLGTASGLEDGIQMTLIAFTQVQLTTEFGKLDAGGWFDRTVGGNQQAITARLATLLRLSGGEIAHCHFEQWLFFIDHCGQVRANRLTVDHSFATALQKPERVRVTAKPITLVERLSQG